MKHHVVGLTIALSGTFVCVHANVPPSQEHQMVIGTIDIAQILTESKAVQEINKEVESVRAQCESQIQAEEKKLQTRETALLEKQKTESPESFEKLRKEFEKSVSKLQKDVMSMEEALKQASQKAMDQLKNVVQKLAKEISVKRKFQVVFPTSSAIYAHENGNITPQVIAELNKKLPSIKLDIQNLQLPGTEHPKGPKVSSSLTSTPPSIH